MAPRQSSVAARPVCDVPVRAQHLQRCVVAVRTLDGNRACRWRHIPATTNEPTSTNTAECLACPVNDVPFGEAIEIEFDVGSDVGPAGPDSSGIESVWWCFAVTTQELSFT